MPLDTFAPALQFVAADERAAKPREGVMDVAPVPVARDKAVAVDPGEGRLDDPSVPLERLAGLDAALGNAGAIPRRRQACRQRRCSYALSA